MARPLFRYNTTLFGLVSLVLLVVSLGQNAFLLERDPPNNVYPSFGLFLFGWLGLFAILDGDFQALGWCANPCLMLGMLFLFVRNRLGAILAGVAALAFASCSVMVHKVLMNEAGHTANVAGFGMGFYFWLASILVQLGSAIFVTMEPDKSNPTTTITDSSN